MRLTDRKRAILLFVADQNRRRGYAPSFREIAFGVGLRSNSAVAAQLRSMRNAGLLEASPLLNRTVRLSSSVTVWPDGAITQTVLISRCPRCRIDHPDDFDCRTVTPAAAPGLSTTGSR